MIKGKVLLLEAVLKTIKADNLLQKTAETGDILLGGLKDLEKKFPGIVNSSRGLGTFCSIDAANSEMYI